jgi:hypothetical protein
MAVLRWPMVTTGRLVRMGLSATSSAFAGFRFPREVITVAVRWYLRYGLSYRDVEELLAERGIMVDHVTVFRWVQRFTQCSSKRPGRAAGCRATGGLSIRRKSRSPGGRFVAGRQADGRGYGVGGPEDAFGLRAIRVL